LQGARRRKIVRATAESRRPGRALTGLRSKQQKVMSTQVQIPMKPPAAPARPVKPAPSGALQRKCACGGSGGSGGECAECAKKKLQRRAAGAGPDVAPPIVHDVLRSPGRPLDGATRAYFEPRFGHDFGKVRVHADPQANESAQSVNALAYTVGPHIAFASGLYRPHAAGGQQLLAHELTHVVQQKSGVPAYGSLRIGPEGDSHEREAEAASAAIGSGPQAALPSPAAAPASVQRVCGRAGIGKPGGCTGINGDLAGEHYLFVVDCDDFRPGEEARLRTFAAGLAARGTVAIHGFASEEGDPGYNESLSCARAIKGQTVIDGVVAPKGIHPNYQLFEHGATAGNRDDRRSITVVSEPAKANPAPAGPASCVGGGTTVDKLAVCVQPIVVANDDGTSPLAGPSFAEVVRIWDQCCLDVTVNDSMTVNNSALKQIDDAGSGAPMTADETKLFAPAAGGGCIPVATVDSIKRAGVANKGVAGGGTTKDMGTNQPKVIVDEGADPRVVAHEVGHALTLQHSDDVGGNTVMHPTGAYNIANPDGVTAAICTKARLAQVINASKADQCCEKTI
jgi:outer membrane protein OmpA-like peptidoglycan-associated protein